MAGFVIAVAALVVAVVVIGVIAVAVGVRREDRRYSLIGEAPGRLAKRVRRLNGVGLRDLDTELFRQAR